MRTLTTHHRAIGLGCGLCIVICGCLLLLQDPRAAHAQRGNRPANPLELQEQVAALQEQVDLLREQIDAIKMPGWVTNSRLADDSINTVKLQGNSVTSSKIVDGDVETQDLAEAAVTTAKIENGTILPEDLAFPVESGASTARVFHGTTSSPYFAGGDVSPVPPFVTQIVNPDLTVFDTADDFIVRQNDGSFQVHQSGIYRIDFNAEARLRAGVSLHYEILVDERDHPEPAVLVQRDARFPFTGEVQTIVEISSVAIVRRGDSIWVTGLAIDEGGDVGSSIPWFEGASLIISYEGELPE